MNLNLRVKMLFCEMYENAMYNKISQKNLFNSICLCPFFTLKSNFMINLTDHDFLRVLLIFFLIGYANLKVDLATSSFARSLAEVGTTRGGLLADQQKP